MAEAIGLASALITLVTFSIQSSSALHQTIKDFNSHKRIVRELKEELEELRGILSSLHQAVLDSKADFTALKTPLLRCGNACNEFEMVIRKATENSHGPRTSIRDWAKLRYMGGDITSFKNALASYKATITIALCDANLRTSTVTAGVLNEYQDMIKDTKSDLEERLQNIDSQLQTLVVCSQVEAEVQVTQEERESIQQCLDICAEVSAHIDKVQSAFTNVITPAGERSDYVVTVTTASSARCVTEEALQSCKDTLTTTSSGLRRQLDDVRRRLDGLNRPTAADPAEQKKMQDEIESIKKSLAICDDASEKVTPNRISTYTRVSLGDDGHQLLVSTVGDLIDARDVSAGKSSAQWLGQMSDDSLQQLSRDRLRLISKDLAEQVTEKKVDGSPKFEDRYGQGHPLRRYEE